MAFRRFQHAPAWLVVRVHRIHPASSNKFYKLIVGWKHNQNIIISQTNVDLQHLSQQFRCHRTTFRFAYDMSDKDDLLLLWFISRSSKIAELTLINQLQKCLFLFIEIKEPKMQESSTTNSSNGTKPYLFSRENESGIRENIAKSHCWYCNKPLHTHRNYCSTECREAMFEDNEQARERRLIFGCQC